MASSDSLRPPLRPALFLGMALAILGTLVWRPLPTGIWHDDGVYLLIAKALASGDGLTYAGVVGAPPAAKFPPLYPLVLTPLWVFGDDLAAGSGWVAGLNVLFMAGAAALFAAFLIRHLEVGRWVATSTAALAWASPALWKLTAIPLSEPLFLLATTAALVTARGATESGEGWRPLGFLAALAVVFYTRTIGIAILGAAVLALIVRRRPGRAAVLSAAGAGIVLPWLVWSRLATARIDEPFRDLLGSYGGWLLGQISASPARYLDAISTNLSELVLGWVTVAVPGASGPVSWGAALVLGGTLLVGGMRVWRVAPVLVGYPLLYLAILALWPYRSGRLFAPAIPFLGTLTVFGVLELRTRLTGGARAAWTTLAACGAVWFTAHAAWTLGTGAHLESFQIRARTLAHTVDVIEETAPASAVVGAPELWAAIHLHTGRIVAPSARFLPLDPAGVPWGTPTQQYAMWRSAGIDHVLVEHGGRVHGAALDRIDATCAAGTVSLLASFPGPSYFVRLGWDTACLGSLQHTE